MLERLVLMGRLSFKKVPLRTCTPGISSGNTLFSRQWECREVPPFL